MKRIVNIIILIQSFTILYASQKVISNFNHFTIQDGLSHSNTNKILETKDHFLWIGTEDGLNRFDGLDFKVFHPIPFDTNSIIGTSIETFIEDYKGNIWITTNNGVSVYNPVIEQFRQVKSNFKKEKVEMIEVCHTIFIYNDIKIYKYNHKFNQFDLVLKDYFANLTINDIQVFNNHVFICTSKGLWILNDKLFEEKSLENPLFLNDKNNCEGIENYNVTTIVPCNGDEFVIGTEQNELLFAKQNQLLPDKANNTSARFRHYKIRYNQNQIPVLINQIHQGKSNYIWVATSKGLLRLKCSDMDTTSKWYFSEKQYHNQYGENSINRIFEDSRGDLWVSSKNNLGIFYYNAKTDQFFHINNQNSNGQLPANGIVYFYEDHSGLVWFSVQNYGLSNYNPKNAFYEDYRVQDANKDNLIVFAINQLDSGRLALGTNNGLVVYNVAKRIVDSYYQYNQGSKSGVSAKIISAIEVIRPDSVWIGYLDGQMSLFNSITKQFENFQFTNSGDNYFPYWMIQDLLYRKPNTLYIAAGSKIVQFNTKNHVQKNLLELYTDKEIHRSNTCLEIDKDNNLWAGTTKNGTIRINLTNQSFESFSYDYKKKNSISNNYISGIKLGKEGNIIWIATRRGGLNKFHPDSGIVKIYTEENGLASNSILSIEMDSDDNLWLSTSRGFSFFDTKKEQFLNFSISNYQSVTSFTPFSSFASATGSIYFGHSQGFTLVRPKDRTQSVPEVITSITDIYLFNERVRIGHRYNGQLVLNKSVMYQDTVALNHRNNDISFKITPFFYPDPKGVRLYYKMENYDENWKSTQYPNNLATYTNLPAGKYKFVVAAGSTLAPQDLKIIIIWPPWYRTFWFRIVLISGLLAMFYLVMNIRMQRFKQREKILNQLVLERTSNIEHEKQEIQKKIAKLTLSDGDSDENLFEPRIRKILDEMSINFKSFSQADSQFVRKLVLNINNHISDPDYSITDLASDMAMSRSSLHNHIKKTIGLSAVDFIVRYKMISSAIFLMKGYSISEILFQIGINSRSYFNRCFKSVYGMTPTEYMENNRQ